MNGPELLLQIVSYRRAGSQPAVVRDWTAAEWGRWAARVYGDAIAAQTQGIKQPDPYSPPWIPPVQELLDATVKRNRLLTAVALALRAFDLGFGIDVAGPWGARAGRLGATADDEDDARQLLADLVVYEQAARTC